MSPSIPWRVVLALSFAACGEAHPPSSTTDGSGATAVTNSTHLGASDAAIADCDGGTVGAEGTCVLACPAGRVQCGSRCVDLSTDVETCGACDHACGSLQSCYAGTCSAGCPAGTVVCAAKCVEPNADPSHCGATSGCGDDGGSPGTVCASNESCLGGQCLGDCPNNQTSCSGVCTNTTSDSNNCGACGHACGTGMHCSAQLCCPTGTTACSGACVNTKTDASACGSCGNRCATGQTCVSGSCR